MMTFRMTTDELGCQASCSKEKLSTPEEYVYGSTPVVRVEVSILEAMTVIKA